MFEKFKANRIRHKGIRRAEKDLQNSGKTGLALYDFVQEYTGDPNPWIKNPYGFFQRLSVTVRCIGQPKNRISRGSV
ncbi:hypothetical protein [Lacticaseibacillus camelliae]|uniref:hypothetical protein n=1 Tax=Lacticaseibacillus camelliae TaxID=381742 RepID=UPI0006D203A0|nr:hypothetical protein [Lacticaseibacillus camelliae]